MAGRYFGLDGCPGGWVLVGLDEGVVSPPVLVRAFAEALEQTRGAALVLVDIPIGLPDARQRERRCDAAARKVLGARSRSVFPVPVREVLDLPAASRHDQVSAHQRRLTGRGLTVQAYHLLPKIREVDGVMRKNPRLQEQVRESHPELCFAALNGGRPMRHRKRDPEGYAERVEVLRRYIPQIPTIADGVRRSRWRDGCAADDVLDALALAVNAWLGVERGLRVLPGEGEEHDVCGLRMEIVAARWQG